MKKTFIIHPDCISGDLRGDRRWPFLTPNERMYYRVAQQNIEAKIYQSGTVIIDGTIEHQTTHPNIDTYLLLDDNPEIVKHYIDPGDDVTFMGAYRDDCILDASRYATECGASSVRVPEESTVTKDISKK